MIQLSNFLVHQIESLIKNKIVRTSIPPQGMGSSVLFVSDNKGNEYAVKISEENNNDANVLKILKENNVTLAVPKLIGNFSFEGKSVVVLEKIDSHLLDSSPFENLRIYIPSMIDNLRNLHTIKSDTAGYLNSDKKYKLWKDFLLSFFDCNNPNLDWKVIYNRKGLDTKLVRDSIQKIIEIIKNTEFISSNYSLLHSDFNQRNLFIDPVSDKISAIIDWGEAMYGDPIFDFARIRMFIWHFNLDDNVVEGYYNLMSYTPEQKKLDTLYWVCRVIEYLAYYSEELNEFNTGRIKLHQNFLKDFNWNILN